MNYGVYDNFPYCLWWICDLLHAVWGQYLNARHYVRHTRYDSMYLII